MDNEVLINGYFEDSLSQTQRKEFERLLESDAEFAADFEFERELQSSLKKEERQEIKALFSNLEAETKVDNTESTETKVISLRPWLVAASIIVLLGFGSWLLLFNGSDLNTDQLYAANFVPYENVVHPIERGEQIEDLKTKAFAAYEDADYALALERFTDLRKQQTDPYIAFYEAIVSMQLNKHEKAIPLLENYIENDGQLKDRASWYLALAYLKQNDIVKSKVQLENLIKKNGFKSTDAKTLLAALE